MHFTFFLRIIRFELITLRLKGEYSTNWVTFPSIRRKKIFSSNTLDIKSSIYRIKRKSINFYYLDKKIFFILFIHINIILFYFTLFLLILYSLIKGRYFFCFILYKISFIFFLLLVFFFIVTSLFTLLYE